MTTLYIVRHGNTFDPGETIRRIGARTDLPLSVSGRAQAEALGAYFSEKQTAFDQIYAAPLKRTQHTAAAIAAHAAPSIKAALEPMLTEVDYGPDENQPEEKVIERLGADAIAAWNAASIPPPGWIVDPDALTGAWRRLFQKVAGYGPNAAALAVTSNGVARFALDAANEAAPDLPKKLRTGAFGRVDISEGKTVIAEWDIRP